ncbi:MAG: nitroreductase family protein [Nitrospirae bacterium]|nr:nitroreductase family protein [Nitrospirota bacterium]
MSAMEILYSRRSIRKYTTEAVSGQALHDILEAAMSAPSAGNQQPWHFIVINDRKLLDQIPSLHPHSLMCRESSMAILVCGDPSLEKHVGYWVQDCAAATENLLLAIHAVGLGGVWVGVYPREDRVTGFRKLFGIPEQVIPFALIPIGHPAEEKPPRSDRYNQSRIHNNTW